MLSSPPARTVRLVLRPAGTWQTATGEILVDHLFQHVADYYKGINDRVLIAFEWLQTRPFRPDFYLNRFRFQQELFTGNLEGPAALCARPPFSSTP